MQTHETGGRRAKAALYSGWKTHPATFAPAGATFDLPLHTLIGVFGSFQFGSLALFISEVLTTFLRSMLSPELKESYLPEACPQENLEVAVQKNRFPDR